MTFKIGKIPWNKEKHYNSKPCSNETKLKISKANKGKKHTVESRLHMSLAHIGNKSYWEGKKRTEETKNKISVTKISQKLTKEKSSNWQGGITAINELIRRTKKYNDWRESVYKRDNFTCKLCGKTKCGLNAHHIEPYHKVLKKYKPETVTDAYEIYELWDLNNGITLCEKCHKKIHFGECNE